MRISKSARSPARTRLTISASEAITGATGSNAGVPMGIGCIDRVFRFTAAALSPFRVSPPLMNREAHVTTDRLTTPWWALRAVIGAAAYLAGLDKFFNLLANWPGYLSPMAAGLVPLDASSFMHLIGIVEMAVGAVILAGYTRVGGYVAAAWLLGIALNLVASGRYFDIAVRDVVMAM